MTTKQPPPPHADDGPDTIVVTRRPSTLYAKIAYFTKKNQEPVGLLSLSCVGLFLRSHHVQLLGDASPA